MKRTLSFMVMALALLLTQCRKPEVKFPTPSSAEGVTVSMTVTAGPGSKTDITTAGAITWSANDKIYVGDGTKYVGYLTLQGAGGSATGTFSGDVTLTDASDGEKMFHFFYLGSGDYTSLTKGSSTSVDVDFSSQEIYADNGKLKNASAQHVGYGSAKGTVTDGVVTGINVTLVSKVALARFSFKKGGTGYSKALTLSGTHIYNKMKVKFDVSGFDFTPVKDKNISLTNETSSEKYVMLVPVGTGSETLSFAGEGFACSTTLGSGIESNKFYGRDGAIEVKPVEFTVGMDGETPITVQFSPGNLWADATDAENPVFHFEANQWDTNPAYSETEEGDGIWDESHVSHFYWSKSADVAVAEEYEDAEASTEDNFFTNETKTTADPDFHVNGETGENQWRTLSNAEWSYLIGESSSGRATSLREWSAVTFGESGPTVNGLIIMPDDWEGTLTETTEYTTWQELEASGAVFLPAAGRREGAGVYYVGSDGYYCSSTAGGPSYAGYMGFVPGDVSTYHDNRDYGNAVRLVR